MELVYVYIGKCKSLENVGVNLSEKYKIAYDSKKSKLNIKESETFIENFWNTANNIQTEAFEASIDKAGIITSVHAIVGDNGAGKTTILKFIRDFFKSGNSYQNQSGFFIFFNKLNCEFSVVCCGENFDSEKFNDNSFYKIKGYNYKNVYGINPSPDAEYLSDYNSMMRREISLSNPKIIYINTNLDSDDYKEGYSEGGTIINLTTGGLIFHYASKDGIMEGKIDKEYDKIRYFFSKEILSQFNFLLKYKEDKFKLPFKKPEFLRISLDNFNSYQYIKDVIEYIDQEKVKKEILKNTNYDTAIGRLNNIFTGNINSIESNYSQEREIFENRSHKEKVFIFFIESIVQAVIRSIFPAKQHINVKEYKKEAFAYFLDLFQNLNFNENDDIPSIINKYIEFINKAGKSINREEDLFKNYIEFLNWLFDNYESMLSYISNDRGFFFDIETEDNNSEFLNTLLDYYSKVSKSYSFLDFSWGLSSGEFNFLSLYARLYLRLDEVDGKIKELKSSPGSKEFLEFNENIGEIDLLLLMDEPDLTFHPRWQQEYIKSLVNFLPSIYKNCNIKIIVTTHSPIMLSDIPKQNVTFINEDGKICPRESQMETFGANIHNLFRDSFFMDNTIGKFAYEKINDIIFQLKAVGKEKNEGTYNENKTKEEYIKKVINNIGEPLIKNKLEKMYNDIFPEKLDLDDQIKKYKNDILKLQNYIKNSATIDKTTLMKLNEELEITSKQIKNIIDK